MLVNSLRRGKQGCGYFFLAIGVSSALDKQGHDDYGQVISNMQQA